MKTTVIECAQAGGRVLLEHFGKIHTGQRKESQSSIVTEADLASEKRIIALIRQWYPGHNIIAEESGFQDSGSEFTWVIDPLDGTSNFAAGIPWCGILVTVLKEGVPVVASSYLPVLDQLYVAEQGAGVYRNGVQVRVSEETNLSNILCAYGMDCSPDEDATRREVTLLGRLVNRVRNVRTTNSLVDFCYTIDGRLGAVLNQSTKIWDIAPAWLMLKEAGGMLSDFEGREVVFSLESDCCAKSYAVVGSNLTLLPQIIDIIQQNSHVAPHRQAR